MAVSRSSLPPVKRLWSQAPIWKVAAVLAIVSTWLFLLFPPRVVVDQARVLAQFGPVASYKPRAQSTASPSSIRGLDQVLHTTPAPSAVVDTGEPAHAAPATIEPSPKMSPRPLATMTAKTTEEPGKQPLRVTSSETGVHTAAVMGQSFSKTFTVNGYDLPLPEGRWQVLADLPGHQQDLEQHQYALGRIDHQALRGLIAFISVVSTANPAPGFPAFPSCDAGINYFAETEVNTPFDRQACWSVRPVHSARWSRWADRSVKLGPLERAAAGQLEAMQVRIPQDMVAVEFDLGAKPSRVIGVYMFNPEVEGIAPSTSEEPASNPWLLSNLTQNPKAVTFVQDRKAWGRSNWPQFKNAFAER